MPTCEHCCGADMLFDRKVAEKEMKSYKKKGAKRVTSILIQLLSMYSTPGASLLDIGGGIGAIQWEFLSNGASHTTDVDASGSYLNMAGNYAEEKDWSDKTQFIQGDFVDVSEKTEMHDVVSLDKVVCCYPDYKEILIKATSKCKKSIALSYPMGGFIAQVFRGLGVIYMKLKQNPFKPYVHNPSDIENLIISQGFVKSQSTFVFPWHVQMYSRVQPVDE